MACPFPDCQSSAAKVAVRYGAREVECGSCGTFKMSDKLFESAAGIFSQQQDSLDGLRAFIRARNQEGKVPMLTDENWAMLAADQKHAESA
jgi:hypothetical protein